MRFLKWFTFLIWLVLCTIINKLFVLTNWQYTWGVFVGSIAVSILNVFDLFIERNWINGLFD